jgi:HAMP domain-containing protein
MPDRFRSLAGFPLVAWTAVVQGLLLAFCWLVLGVLNARGTWLLSESQLAEVARLFRLPLPLVGLAGTVIVPAALAAFLVREAQMPGLLDTDFVVRTLRLPSQAGLAGLVSSVVAFNVAAFRLRATHAIPAVEAAKISALGFLTGTLLCVLSYFALQPLVRPLIEHALDRGAIGPDQPSFPIRKKVLACSLAIAAIVSGLFGLQAFVWAQRSVEQEALSTARTLANSLAAMARAHPPQGPGAWRTLLRSEERPAGTVVYATGASERLLASDPDPMPRIERFLVSTRFFDAAAGADPEAAFVTRWGDVRAVARAPISAGTTVGVIVRTDPTVLRNVLRSFLVVGLEVLAAALLLAWTAARGITKPIARLQRNLEEFASERGGRDPRPIVTDDEITRLSGSFGTLETAVRQAQERVAELSRRSEREVVLARIAHELRNPLFGIQSTLSALELATNGDHGEYFGVLRRETQRISRLVDRMLEGSPAATESGAPLGSVLADAERLVAARLPEARLAIVRSSETHGARVPVPQETAVVLFADLCEWILQRAGGTADIVVESDEAARLLSLRSDAPAVAAGAGADHQQPGDDLLASCRTRVEAAGGTLTASLPAVAGTVLELRFPASGTPLNS